MVRISATTRISRSGGRRVRVGAGGIPRGRAEHAVEDFVGNADLQLLGGVFHIHVEQVHIGLRSLYVVALKGERFGLLDQKVLVNRGRNFVRQIGPDRVVRDGQRRRRADAHGIALVLDFTFPVGVGDLGQLVVDVILGVELLGPQQRIEYRRDSRAGEKRCTRRKNGHDKSP